MVSSNIETLNFGANLPLLASLIKLDVGIATFKNLLKMAVIKEPLKNAEMENLS